jgi:hypothetical protein
MNRRARILVALAAGCALALLVVSGALAASPQKIYADYADNGQLNGSYSKADLERALQSAVVAGYGHGQTQGLKPAIKSTISNATTSTPSNTTTSKPATSNPATTKTSTQGSGQGVLAAPPVKSSGGLPFTGLDLGLITIGAISLLLFGAALRRFARHKA